MKAAAAGVAFLTLSIAVASAGELVRAESPALCFGRDICDEWRVADDPRIRVVRHGYHDGVETTLYKVDKKGTYVPLIDIDPIVRDSSGRLWWGYPERILKMPYELTGNRLTVWATFDSQAVTMNSPSIDCLPPWMKRVPAVLFTGNAGPGHRGDESQRLKYSFVKMPLDRMIALARKKAPRSQPQMKCSGRCCYLDDDSSTAKNVVEPVRPEVRSWYRSGVAPSDWEEGEAPR